MDKYRILRKRDLFWIIGILIFVIITIYSVRLSDNEDLINIFSFMSNGVSIVLAIVAIIFAFYQSLESERQNSETKQMLLSVNLQINNLISAKGNEVNISKLSKDELDEIGKSIEELKNSKDVNGEVQNKFDELRNKVKELKDKQNLYGEYKLTEYRTLRNNFENGLCSQALGRVNRRGEVSVENDYNDVERIERLGFELIALIGNGRKETIKKIEEEIKSGSVVKYLGEKYKEQLFINLQDSSTYNLNDWEKAFSNYAGWVEGNESRKFGIINEDDGLLLLLGLVLDIIQFRKSRE